MIGQVKGGTRSVSDDGRARLIVDGTQLNKTNKIKVLQFLTEKLIKGNFDDLV